MYQMVSYWEIELREFDGNWPKCLFSLEECTVKFWWSWWLGGLRYLLVMSRSACLAADTRDALPRYPHGVNNTK